MTSSAEGSRLSTTISGVGAGSFLQDINTKDKHTIKTRCDRLIFISFDLDGCATIKFIIKLMQSCLKMDEVARLLSET